MNTKLNRSDYIVIILYFATASILNIIEYLGKNLKAIEYWVDIPSSIITSLITIFIFMYWIIPQYLVTKKYFLFLLFTVITLITLGGIDDTLGYLSAGRKLNELPVWYKVVINAIYTSSNNSGLLLGILFTKKFYESQNYVDKVQKQQKENELKLLRSQIDPHFLFNNLNTLDSLIDSDSEKAKEYINRLSLIYRYLIQTKDSEVMELSEEIQLAENYIFLIKTRFGNDYDFEVNTLSSIDDKFIPTGALQTLLENVVKHNKPEKDQSILTKIYIEDSWLTISNMKSNTISKNESFGTGLENLKTRYQLLSDQKVHIKDSEKEFSVTIPIIKLTE